MRRWPCPCHLPPFQSLARTDVLTECSKCLSHGRWCAGLEVIGQIEEPGYLEGGDFTPAGQDLALLGVGLRSNMEAAQQLMDKDLLGARRFAVVKDDFEQHQVASHPVIHTPFSAESLIAW